MTFRAGVGEVVSGVVGPVRGGVGGSLDTQVPCTALSWGEGGFRKPGIIRKFMFLNKSHITKAHLHFPGLGYIL